MVDDEEAHALRSKLTLSMDTVCLCGVRCRYCNAFGHECRCHECEGCLGVRSNNVNYLLPRYHRFRCGSANASYEACHCLDSGESCHYCGAFIPHYCGSPDRDSRNTPAADILVDDDFRCDACAVHRGLSTLPVHVREKMLCFGSNSGAPRHERGRVFFRSSPALGLEFRDCME